MGSQAVSSHAGAVLDAEVRLLADVLAPFGVLSREELARGADASLWHEGSFEAALRAGVERGVLNLLPFDFVELRDRRVAVRPRPGRSPDRSRGGDRR
jgi:hypothetical protein